MPKIMNKKPFLIVFLLLSQFCNAQTPPKQIYKGMFFSMGRLHTNSLKSLNEPLSTLKLPQFDSPIFFLKYGYCRIGKRNIYLAFNGEISSQSKSDDTYTLSLTSSQIGGSVGYRFFDNNKFSLIPNIGVSVGGGVLGVSSSAGQNSQTVNFKDALLQTKTTLSNTLVLSHLGLSTSLIGFYKLGLTDEEEIIENGVLNVKRLLPIGFEIGYRHGKDLSDWSAALGSLTNSPALNLSGLFFCIRVGGVIKSKSMKI
jgi:hypothetical protein